VAGYASSFAATTSGTFLTGNRNAVLVTRDGGRSWPISYAGAGNLALDSGYLQVGSVDENHGFVIPASPSSREIDLTADGGHTWIPARFAP
jgi:photosystem II stability/assembly factor-like uncharacterized protein